MKLSPVQVRFKVELARSSEAQRYVPGDGKTCKTKHMTRGMILTREWHVLKCITVIARIKVTLTPVINWTGQLQHTWSVKCEEVWKKIPRMFQDTHTHTHTGGRIKASTSRAHLWLARLIITLKEKSALSSSYNGDAVRGDVGSGSSL